MSRRRANGEGTIFRRKDGRYQAAVYLPTPNGGRVRRYVYGRTRQDVHEKLTALLRLGQQNVPVSDQRWTVAAYLDYWITQVVAERLRPKTLVGYEGVIRLHLVPAIGKKQLDKADRAGYSNTARNQAGRWPFTSHGPVDPCCTPERVAARNAGGAYFAQCREAGPGRNAEVRGGAGLNRPPVPHAARSRSR